MSWDEHVMLIAHTVNAFGGSRHGGRGGGEDGRGLLVVGNTGSNATREALHATEQDFAVGMDCSLQINPYYGKTSAAGLLKHFGAALSEGAHREGGGRGLRPSGPGSRGLDEQGAPETEPSGGGETKEKPVLACRSFPPLLLSLFPFPFPVFPSPPRAGPAMLYNVPGRTGQDIPDEVVLSLAESHPDSFLGERRERREERERAKRERKERKERERERERGGEREKERERERERERESERASERERARERERERERERARERERRKKRGLEREKKTQPRPPFF